jgi:hypothetical protein
VVYHNVSGVQNKLQLVFEQQYFNIEVLQTSVDGHAVLKVVSTFNPKRSHDYSCTRRRGFYDESNLLESQYNP